MLVVKGLGLGFRVIGLLLKGMQARKGKRTLLQGLGSSVGKKGTEKSVETTISLQCLGSGIQTGKYDNIGNHIGAPKLKP